VGEEQKENLARSWSAQLELPSVRRRVASPSSSQCPLSSPAESRREEEEEVSVEAEAPAERDDEA
jgi:hypothetical protein